MNTKQEYTLNMHRHTLVSVEKADPLPTWLPDGNWYRYIIRQGSSDLEGYIIGSLPSATEYAESVTANMNERSINGKFSPSVNKKRSPQSAPAT